MLKRLRVWSYLTLAAGASLFAWGCSGGGSGLWPWNTSVDSLPRIIAAILREDLFS